MKGKINLMDELIERNKDESDVRMMPPLVWAYIGDSIYDLFIRMNLVNTTRLHPHELHVETIKFVKAKAQCKLLKRLEDLNFFSEEEEYVIKQGRNAQNHHIPKNVDIYEYMYATAFEALIGYLYLMKKNDRLKEILKKCLEEN